MSEAQMVHKVTLSSDKVVLLREMKIKDQRMAARAAGATSGDNINVMGVGMAEEILKLLIVQINDAAPPKAQLEDLDSLFSYKEYQELQVVLAKIMGMEDGEKTDPKMEVVSFGAQ